MNYSIFIDVTKLEYFFEALFFFIIHVSTKYKYMALQRCCASDSFDDAMSQARESKLKG